MHPDTLGRYTLVRPLAQGGMGDVFLAKVTGAAGFTRPAVIKTVRPELKNRDDAVGMFLDEARLSAQLSHPHIVQVFDLGETDDGFYMAMEFVDGTHLGRLMRASLAKKQPLPVPVCVYIVARVAEALHYAHHALNLETGEPLQVVHRDVSPSNILISKGGDVKLTDFGVAKARTQQVKTAMGYVKGKVAYLSPEQIDLKKIDGRSDVFSLGVVLWECLARMRLYKEDSEFVAMDRIAEEPAPHVRRYNPDVPEEVEALALRALEKAPGDRFATAGAFQDALDEWLREQGIYHARQALAGSLIDFAEPLGLTGSQTAVTDVFVPAREGSVSVSSALAGEPSSVAEGEPASSPEGGRQSAEAVEAPASVVEAASTRAEIRTGESKLSTMDGRRASRGAHPTLSLEGEPEGAGHRSASHSEASQSSPARQALPRFDTPFVGRSEELAAMSAHYKGDGRFLTLCGPEGIGKTRLAVEFARRLHDPSTGGLVSSEGGPDKEDAAVSIADVFYSDVGGAPDLDAVCERMAAGLGVSLLVGKNAADAVIQLGAALKERESALYLLDSVDDTTAVVDAVAALLATAPGARFLATSRLPLSTDQATVFMLKPLRQKSEHDEDQAERAGFDAIDLFVQRVRTLRPEYVLTNEDAATVARIVARLGGNPLAIEIAAGQVTGTDVGQLLGRMDEEELSGFEEDSVSVALDLGLKALSRAEQEALLQAAIFPGRMSGEASSAVLQLVTEEPVDAVLGRLVQKSLLRRESVVVNGVRHEGYRLADGIRARAAEQLELWPGRGELEERFDRYHLEVGEELVGAVDGPLGLQARGTLRAELENFIAVSDRSLRHRPGQRSADLAIRAALILDAHYATVGPTTQHLGFLDRAAEQLQSFDETDPRLAVLLLLARGQARYFRGWANEAIVDLEDAVRKAEAHQDDALLARALTLLAQPLRALRPSSEVVPVLDRALLLSEATQDPRLRGRAKSHLGALQLDLGRQHEAQQLLEEAVELLRDSGDKRSEAICTGHLAQACHLAGEADRAMSLASRALGLYRSVDDRRGEAEVTGLLGDFYAEAPAVRRDVSLADDLYRRALRLAREVGDQRREAILLAAVGSLEAEAGEREAALTNLDAAESLLLSAGLGNLVPAVSLFRAQLDVSEAEDALSADDRHGALTHLHKAEALLGAPCPAAGRSAHVRLKRAVEELKAKASQT